MSERTGAWARAEIHWIEGARTLPITDTDSLKVIDMRLRPPAAGFEKLALYWDRPRIYPMTRDIGFEPAPSYVNESFEQMLTEMDEAGIVTGVITGRQGSQRMGNIDNAEIETVVRQHPDRFIGMGGVDTGTLDIARRHIQEILDSDFLRGAVIESGCADEPKYADDPDLDSIFGDCEDAGLPVLLMAGGNAGPDVTYSHPVQIDRIAARHPNLQIVAAHGSWPWVQVILGIAYRRRNVWVSPDMYLFLPGWRDYVDAANGYLQDRFLFGTAYPALPFKETVERFLELPFREDVKMKLLFDNAQRLFQGQ